MGFAVQLQQDKLWSTWVDVAFNKLDSNGDGYIDLDELISLLPADGDTDASLHSERLLEVGFDSNFMHNLLAASFIVPVCCKGQELSV